MKKLNVQMCVVLDVVNVEYDVNDSMTERRVELNERQSKVKIKKKKKRKKQDNKNLKDRLEQRHQGVQGKWVSNSA